MRSSEVTHEARPTWGDLPGPLSLITAARALLGALRDRDHWDVSHVHMSEFGSFIREGLVVIVSRWLGRPVVVSLHGAQFDVQAVRHPRVTRLILARADHVLCLGDAQRSIVNKVSPSTAVSVIANPVADEAFCGVNHATARAGVLFVGEVGERKGIDRLLEAWMRVREVLPEADLRVVGPLAVEESRIEAAGATYAGVLERADVLLEMRSAVCTVLPSRAEVLPMAILESLAQGTPVVYTRVGEWRNFVGCPGVTLLDGSDHASLVSDLSQKLLSRLRTPPTRTDCEAASEWARAYASSSVVEASLAAVYRAVTEERAQGRKVVEA